MSSSQDLIYVEIIGRHLLIFFLVIANGLKIENNTNKIETTMIVKVKVLKGRED